MSSAVLETSVGIVVIGRNEGPRLIACLAGLARSGQEMGRVVYVDSGSTDGSVAAAEASGARVLRLDMSVPFTAARARNSGWRALLEGEAKPDYVQFVDGDCELAAGWLGVAAAELAKRPDVVAVAGRLRERYPERSIYNRLCDMEWDVPAGEVAACGGIVMMRGAALVATGGFNDSLIAGEEPELCLRLRRAGGKVVRLQDEMALHDAAMMRFSQWWTRAVRSGFACAAGRSLHGSGPELYCVAECQRILRWGLWLPAVAIILAVPTIGISISLTVMLYAGQTLRLAIRERRRGARNAGLYAAFNTIGKFAEVIGILRFRREQRSGRHGGLIEYK